MLPVIDQMNDSSPEIIVHRCRALMAKLLTDAVEMTRKLEDRLTDVPGDWNEATVKIDIEADPSAGLGITGALLLRKARIHTVAVLRANETSNLHSLAVQMRPILECAGQVVFSFQTLIVAPDLLMSRENAIATFGERLNADFYQTLRSATRGQVSREELCEMATQAQAKAAASFGATIPQRQKGWNFNQADKVAILAKGHQWYSYLSEHFSHGKGVDWRGLSWQGGVMSMNKIEDEFAFLNLMSYLVKQVTLMNAAAALCPVSGDEDDQRDRWIESTLAQLKDVGDSTRTLVETARAAATGQVDGSTRTN